MRILYIILSLMAFAIILSISNYLFQKYWVTPKKEKLTQMSDDDLIQHYYQILSDLVNTFAPLKEKEISLIHSELQKREIA